MFNSHQSKTGDGVLITEGLRVFTNNLDRGVVVADRDEDHCQEPERPAAQMFVRDLRGWFTDHNKGNDLVCHANHWFTVELDTNYKGEPMKGQAMMDGERMATTFDGKKA